MTEPLLEFFFMECNGIKKTTGDGMTRLGGERPNKTMGFHVSFVSSFRFKSDPV